MNQTQSYSDVGHGHMMNVPHTASSSAPPTAMTHYSNYQQPQPGPHGYSGPAAYPSYGQPNGVAPLHSTGHPTTTPMSAALVTQPQFPLPTIAGNPPPPSGNAPHTFDTTGQIAPHGMKPRVTATLWEDEGSLCFQVEANGVCVARREDNHMINGTKLLNVAGMTRGRRDGILKSEKTRHVVKIGPMHLKGVWIPFDRALDFANKEKITESLYPLFVHNIGALLYHPQNSARQSISGAAIAGAERRRADGQPDYMRTSQSSQTPSLQHHHTMSNSIGAHIPQPPHSIVGHSAAGRPGLDRAHTFPTPPTSASSVMGMGNSGSSYDWPGAHVSGTVQTTQPLTIDTGLSNARSVPTTPATTPPGNNIQNMQNFQTSQPYDNSRQMYTTSGQQSQYGSQPGMTRYATMPAGGYVKSDMAPPARAGAEQEHNGDAKPHDGYANHSQEHHSDAEAEHEGEYTHTAAPYGTNRNTYGYSSNTASSMQGDHGHISPEMTGSPHKTSGRATPRTTQSYPGYSTPQRAQLPSSNLYSVMSDNRNATNGADMYANHGYPTQQYAGTNGIASNKRVRELDDSEEHAAKRFAKAV